MRADLGTGALSRHIGRLFCQAAARDRPETESGQIAWDFAGLEAGDSHARRKPCEADTLVKLRDEGVISSNAALASFSIGDDTAKWQASCR